MSAATGPVGGVGITLGHKQAADPVFANLVTLADDCEFGGQAVTAINIPYLSTVTMPKVPGRMDSGDFTASVYWVPGETSVAGLTALFQNRTTSQWQVMLPDGSSPTTGSTATFSGFISSFKPGNFTGEDAPKLDITIAISGTIIYAAGS